MGMTLMFLVAGSAIPNQYWMSGRVVSADGTADDSFVVAVSDRRCVSARKGGSSASMQYTGAHARSVQIDWTPASATGALSPSDGDLQYVLLSGDVVGKTQNAHLSAVQMASYDNVPFALFFSCDYVGVEVEHVKGNAYRNQCGSLRVDRDARGIQRIVFQQEQQDLLTARLPDQTLEKTTHPYPEGRKRIRYETEFSPSFSSVSTQWVANCLWSCETMSGAIHTVRNRVVVDEFITDVDLVSQRIDEFVAFVPDGHPVKSVGNDPLSYVWQEGKVIRHLDNSSVAIAAEAEFQQAKSWRWLWLLLAVVAAVAITVVPLRNQTKGNS